MAEKTPLDLGAARAIGERFELSVARIAPFAGGSVNSNFALETATNERIFLRVYEEQDRAGAAAELALLEALIARGVPSPPPLHRRDGGLLAEHAGKPVALFPFVPGSTLCQRAVRPEHCERVGAALARVHVSGAEAKSDGRFTPAHLLSRLDSIRGRAPELVTAADEIEAALREHIALRDETLPRGVIHGDLFRDNVLWNDGELTALLDFESASRGVFAYDLAVTILAWCFGDHFEPELVRALVQGYRAVRPLEARELAAFRTEAGIAALRFAATRMTDYTLAAPPGVPPLRDFRRFLARLREIRAGALDAVTN